MSKVIFEIATGVEVNKLFCEAIGDEPSAQREEQRRAPRRPEFKEKEREHGFTARDREAHAHMEPRAHGEVGARPGNAPHALAGKRIDPRMASNMSRQAGRFAAAIYDKNDRTRHTDEMEQEPPPPEYMPALISNALSVNKKRAESYNMKNIVQRAPPMIRRELEQIGKAQFSGYSETPKTLSDIYVVNSLVNSDTEVKQMFSYVTKMGHKISEAETTFPSMPGYKPKSELWEVEDARFLLVRETPKDFSGEEDEELAGADVEENIDNEKCLFYVYGWNEPKGKIDKSEDRRQIR